MDRQEEVRDNDKDDDSSIESMIHSLFHLPLMNEPNMIHSYLYIVLGTPLCRHIREIIAELQTMEASLRKSGQRACVIIATDGESSDGDIASAMKPLEHLPCFVVVRLCTNDPK